MMLFPKLRSAGVKGAAIIGKEQLTKVSTDECQMCHGAGRWEGMGAGQDPCEHCGGTGLVPKDRKLQWWERRT